MHPNHRTRIDPRRLLSRCAALVLLVSVPAAAQHGIPSRPVVDDYFNGTFPTTPPVIDTDWSTEIAFPNLIFDNPLGLTFIPGTNRLIVWEREGRIWSFENDPATTTKTLVLDLSDNCQGWDDSGLLGLALHPDFENNRQMWLWYNWRGGINGGAGDLGPVIGDPDTRPPTGTPTRDRLSRFILDENFQTTQADEYVVIDQKDNSVWHNGGGLFFHPENGFLYITNGDDQNANLNTQRVDRALFSCVMRIDVDRRGGAISHAPTKRAVDEVSPSWPRYFVPNDNPFVGQPDALEEIYAIGLRSPHRMTIDPVTKRIFIGDVGAGSREEVSVIEPNDPAGLNFQWSRIEGKGGTIPAPFIGTQKPPIIDYGHGEGFGSCVVGGYVNRGSEFPELYGKYIFGDNMSGIIWYLDESVDPPAKVTLAVLPDGPGPNSGNDYRGLASFGLDADGELYLCRLSSVEGRIYKLDRGGPAPGSPLPATLAATGLFSDLADLTTDAALIPYDLNEPFWSDHAIKSRFAIVPDAKEVTFRETGDWDFPAGSVLVKHFDLPVSDVDATKTRRLETRVLVKQESGDVYGATYKWRDDQSDADLLESGLTESVAIETEPVGEFTGVDIGNPALSGSTVRDGNLVTITAGGVDIWGARDEFQFAHQLRTGDFDVSVRIESVVQSDLYTKTGLMVRDSLAENARHVMALVFPSNAARNNNTGGYEFQYRATTGGNATALYPPLPQPLVSYPDTWLRMKREGDTFTAYSSSNGYDWTEYASTTLDFPDQIHFGMAVTAHTASPRTVAKFHLNSRRQPWYFPSRQDCITCHNTQAGGVLGPSTRQLNRDLEYPNGVMENQLMAWGHAGLFDDAPAGSELGSLQRLSHHNDTSASLHERARSYLDSNCSYCHRPNGVQALWDARYETPFFDQGIYYGEVVDSLGNPDGRVVVPQSLENSILFHRVSKTGESQMPPLARNLVDEDGIAMLAEWIGSLEEEVVVSPFNLAATAQSQTDVALAWEDGSDNENGFVIQRSLDGIDFETIASLPANTTAYLDSAAEPFQTNSYRVLAFGTYVYSPASNVADTFPDIGPPAPEIRVTGNGILISNNDLTPDSGDGTDMGIASSLGGNPTRQFTVENLGNAALAITGDPRVVIGGADASSFVLLADLPGTINAESAASFSIRFEPVGFGVKHATVSIASNDTSEALTTFAISGAALDEGLIGWWRFDEGAGTIAADLSNFGNDGILTDPYPEWQATGYENGSLLFTGQFNQSVTISNSPSLNPTSAISITSWVYSLDWNGNRRILQKGDADNQYRLLIENGNLVWDIDNVGRLESALPPLDEWFHLAATYNGSRMRLFVNGREIAAQNDNGAIPVTGDDLYLGTKTPGSIAGDHLNGALDELRIYDRALSGTEIAALAGIEPGDGLVAYWRFDETSGAIASDSSGSGNDGTLTNPAPQWINDGRVNGALAFTGAIGQSVTVPNDASLNPPYAITVGGWVNVDNWTGNQRVLQKGFNDNQYRLLSEFGDFVWAIAGVGRLEAAYPPVGQWVHVIATYDGDRMALYYDGIEVAAAGASGGIPVTNNPLMIGTKSTTTGATNYLHGSLDELRVYDRALSASEVARLALEGQELHIVAVDAMARKGTNDFGMITISRTGPNDLALPIPLAFGLVEPVALAGIDFTVSPDLAGFTIPAGSDSANLMIQPIASNAVTGPRVATVTIGEIQGYLPVESEASVTIGDSPYHDWKIAAFGGLSAAQDDAAADDADGDGDGLNTLLEAALGGNPNEPDPQLLPTHSLADIGGELFFTLTYTRPKPPVAGLEYLHQHSFDLLIWGDAALAPGYPVDNFDGTETLRIQTPFPLSGKEEQFLRMGVER